MGSRLLCAVLLAVLPIAATAQSIIGFDEHHIETTEDAGILQLLVVRTGSASGVATVDYTTVGLSAEEGQDYVAAAGTLTFADQETEKNIAFTLLDDNEIDANPFRGIRVELANPTNATIGGGAIDNEPWPAHYLYIHDDDAPPTLVFTYEDLTFPEGDGESDVFMTIHLSHSVDFPVTANFMRHPVIISGDYNGANVTLPASVTFEQGQTTKQVPVDVQGNNTFESGQKTFHYSVGSENASGMEFDIELIEDDPLPTVSIQDATVTEGSWGYTEIQVTLTTTHPVAGTLVWKPVDDTATGADNDYGPHESINAIPFASSTAGTVTVNMGVAVGDLQIEPDETFFIDLVHGRNMAIDRARATITIVNDDLELPRFAEAETTIEEGSAAQLTITFPAPAPAGMVHLEASDPAVTVPATVLVPEQATSISFAASVGKSVGPVAVTAHLAPSLGNAVLSTTVDTGGEAPIRYEESQMVLYAGETATATLRVTAPPVDTDVVTLTASGGLMAPATVMIDADGETAFAFTAMSAGAQWIHAERGTNSTMMRVDVLAPQVQSLSPSSGPAKGGTVVAISGEGFSSGCRVEFGGVPAITQSASREKLLVATPAHLPAQVDVTVICGATPVRRANAFSFDAARRRSVRH